MMIRFPLLFIISIAILSLGSSFNPGYGMIDGYWVALLAYSIVLHELATWQSISHSEKIKRGEWITHWKANIVRSIFIIGLPFLYHTYSYNIVKIGQLIAFGLPYFGLLFNLKLNKLRGLGKFYVGINDKKDSITDRIFSKIPYGGEILFFLSLVASLIFSYIYIVK